jgi:hypothetical protein
VILGRIVGLKQGNNTLSVSAGGFQRAITLIDYPAHGPVFSGPQEIPYRCMTSSAELGTPLNRKYCSAPTQVRYLYMSTASGVLEPFDPRAPRPHDVATTTTSTGETVPFIVRLETGTINRAIYRIAILDDPAQPGPDPWTRAKGWNGRLVYSFGGGCGTGHTQGDADQINILKKKLLAAGYAKVVEKGYAVATSTLNVGSVNCNPVLSAETAMMLKKHFTETYGIPDYTIGTGGSDGAIQQYEIAATYPGILDGITPSDSFPDLFAVTRVIHNCELLDHYFKHSDIAWSVTQKKAVSVEGLYDVCRAWNKVLGHIVDSGSKCYRYMPAYRRSDVVENPEGVRCAIRDHLVNVLGIDPNTHYARNFYDNTGVQY